MENHSLLPLGSKNKLSYFLYFCADRGNIHQLNYYSYICFDISGRDKLYIPHFKPAFGVFLKELTYKKVIRNLALWQELLYLAIRFSPPHIILSGCLPHSWHKLHLLLPGLLHLLYILINKLLIHRILLHMVSWLRLVNISNLSIGIIIVFGIVYDFLENSCVIRSEHKWS